MWTTLTWLHVKFQLDLRQRSSRVLPDSNMHCMSYISIRVRSTFFRASNPIAMCRWEALTAPRNWKPTSRSTVRCSGKHVSAHPGWTSGGPDRLRVMQTPAHRHTDKRDQEHPRAPPHPHSTRPPNTRQSHTHLPRLKDSRLPNTITSTNNDLLFLFHRSQGFAKSTAAACACPAPPPPKVPIARSWRSQAWKQGSGQGLGENRSWSFEDERNRRPPGNSQSALPLAEHKSKAPETRRSP